MSYEIDVQPSGIFTLHHEAGRPMFDGAFRSDIPQGLRMKTLTLLSEAPNMLDMLRRVLSELEAIIAAVVEERGGGALGQKVAHDEAPALFEMKELIEAQIAAAEGGT